MIRSSVTDSHPIRGYFWVRCEIAGRTGLLIPLCRTVRSPPGGFAVGKFEREKTWTLVIPSFYGVSTISRVICCGCVLLDSGLITQEMGSLFDLDHSPNAKICSHYLADVCIGVPWGGR
jgi:hypothetical protein